MGNPPGQRIAKRRALAFDVVDVALDTQQIFFGGAGVDTVKFWLDLVNLFTAGINEFLA